MTSVLRAFTRVISRHSTTRQAVLVLGMHRSGTSFVTGSLQQAGLELGQHSAWNPHNTKGNRENPDIVAFHEELLAARGARWDDPPAGRMRWTRAETARARGLVAAFADAPLWGFKDPRTLLFAQAWRELLPRARFIGVFRHPAAVARSLDARGGMAADKALGLWAHYNSRLLALHAATGFPLLCFDDSETVLHARLNLALRQMGLCELDDERFWAADLRHHEAHTEELPGECAALYQQLRNRAGPAQSAAE